MRVLYVCHHPALGGAERSLLELVEAMPRHGVDPVLAAPPGALLEAANSAGVQTLPLPWIHRLRRAPGPAARAISRLPGAWWRFSRILRRARIDLLHANSTVAQIWCGPAARAAGIPALWHWRDSYELRGLERVLAPCCDGVITVSEAAARAARRRLPSALPVHAVPNPVAPVTVAPRALARRRYGLSPGTFVVGMLGQAVPRKGHLVLMSALERLDGDVRLLLAAPTAGDLRYEAQLRAASAKAPVTWVEGAPERARAEVFGAADLIVVPSLREPFGRVAAEAMRAGRPILASDVDGLREILAATPDHLVPPGDAAALARAIRECRRSPARAGHLGDAAVAAQASGAWPAGVEVLGG